MMFCKTGVLDIYGDHAIACHSRSDEIARHDGIRDKIVSACSIANLSPEVERMKLVPESQSLPATSLSRLGKRGNLLRLIN